MAAPLSRPAGIFQESPFRQAATLLAGSCLCGRVAYQITGPLTDALNCHCAMCRKSHGAAFRSRATVQALSLIHIW